MPKKQKPQSKSGVKKVRSQPETLMLEYLLGEIRAFNATQDIQPEFVKIKDVGQGNCTIFLYSTQESKGAHKNSTYFIIDNGSEGKNVQFNDIFADQLPSTNWTKIGKIQDADITTITPSLPKARILTSQHNKALSTALKDLAGYLQRTESMESAMDAKGTGDSLFILLSHWDSDHVSRFKGDFFKSISTDIIENVYFIHPLPRFKSEELTGKKPVDTSKLSKQNFDKYIVPFLQNNVTISNSTKMYDITVNNLTCSLKDLLEEKGVFPLSSDGIVLEKTKTILEQIFISIPDASSLVVSDTVKGDLHISKNDEGYIYSENGHQNSEIVAEDNVPKNTALKNNMYSMLVFVATGKDEIWVCTGDRFLTKATSYNNAEEKAYNLDAFTPYDPANFMKDQELHLLDEHDIAQIKDIMRGKTKVFFMMPHHGSAKNFSIGGIDDLFKPNVWFFSAANRFDHPSKRIIESVIRYGKGQQIVGQNQSAMFYAWDKLSEKKWVAYNSWQEHTFIMGTNIMGSIKYIPSEGGIFFHKAIKPSVKFEYVSIAQT